MKRVLFFGLCLGQAWAQPAWLGQREVTISQASQPDHIRMDLLAPDGSEQSLGTLPFRGRINLAKIFLFWKGESLHVVSQLPFSSASFVNVYRFRDNEPIWVRAYQEDPSVEKLSEVRRHLALGDIAAASAALEEVMYPGHYYQTKDMALEFLCAAQRKGLEWHGQGQSDRARRLVEEAIRPFEAVLPDWPRLALRDYAVFLLGSGHPQEAVEVLERVLEANPEDLEAQRLLREANGALGSEG